MRNNRDHVKCGLLGEGGFPEGSSRRLFDFLDGFLNLSNDRFHFLIIQGGGKSDHP